LNALLVCGCLSGDDGYFRVETIFLFDHLANRIFVTIAIQDYEFDIFGRQSIGQFFGGRYPMTMGCVTRVAQRPVDEFDVVLIFTQHGNRDALAPVQFPFPGNGDVPLMSVFC
jgi:hypothetical protein